MIGTVANTVAVVVGSMIGVSAGRHIKEGLKQIIMQALGLAVTVIALKMALSGENLIPSEACLLLGALTGELLRIERGVERIGEYLKERFDSGSSTFVQGFVSATLLYITGAMTIIGCIQDGTAGNPDTLFLKSLLDGVASIALASTLGIDFNVDESWDEKKEIFKISGKIVRTRNVTQSSIVKNDGYTTVVAAAVFVFNQ